MTAEAMVVVGMLGGPRDGERFATRLTGVVQGAVFRYFDEEYTFTRDSTTGRWRAIPFRPADGPARANGMNRRGTATKG